MTLHRYLKCKIYIILKKLNLNLIIFNNYKFIKIYYYFNLFFKPQSFKPPPKKKPTRICEIEEWNYTANSQGPSNLLKSKENYPQNQPRTPTFRQRWPPKPPKPTQNKKKKPMELLPAMKNKNNNQLVSLRSSTTCNHGVDSSKKKILPTSTNHCLHLHQV